MYKGTTMVILYPIDENNQVQPVKMTIVGDMTRLQLYAGIKKFVLDTWNKKVSNRWITRCVTIVKDGTKHNQKEKKKYQQMLDIMAIRMNAQADAMELINEVEADGPSSVSSGIAESAGE